MNILLVKKKKWAEQRENSDDECKNIGNCWHLEAFLCRQDSEFRRYDFYPGQQLVGCARAFEGVEWIYRTREMEVALSKPHKSIKVTVEQVQVWSLDTGLVCI